VRRLTAETAFAFCQYCVFADRAVAWYTVAMQLLSVECEMIQVDECECSGTLRCKFCNVFKKQILFVTSYKDNSRQLVANRKSR